MAKFTLNELMSKAVHEDFINLRDEILYNIYLDTGGTTGDGFWRLDGNTEGEEKYIGTNDNFSFPVRTNGVRRKQFYPDGTQASFAYDVVDALTPDITQGDNWNNTGEITIAVDLATYPSMYNRCYLNFYVVVGGTEIMRCKLAYFSSPGVKTLVFERGQADTIAVAHPDGEDIKMAVLYSHYTDNYGRNGIGTNNPDSALSVHLKQSLDGGVSIYNDVAIQTADGNWPSGQKQTVPGRNLCLFFLCENGGFYISPYNGSGFLQDPQYLLEIGKWRPYGINPGMMIHGPAGISWDEPDNGFAAMLIGPGTWSGGIKPLGGAGSYADLQSFNTEDLRLGTGSNPNSAPNAGVKIKAHNAVLGGGFQDAIEVRNNPIGPPKILMYQLPVYTTNALALAGGLLAGQLYRTGLDPDTICIVH